MESIEKADDDTGLKSLIDLAEACPKFLRPQLDQLFAACIKVFQDVNQEDSWRHLALEVVVTMSETAPAMVRKVAGNQLEAAISAILRMMTEIDEEDDWATSDEAADDDSDSNAVVAESALDRMACGLGMFLQFIFCKSCNNSYSFDASLERFCISFIVNHVTIFIHYVQICYVLIIIIFLSFPDTARL